MVCQYFFVAIVKRRTIIEGRKDLILAFHQSINFTLLPSIKSRLLTNEPGNGHTIPEVEGGSTCCKHG